MLLTLAEALGELSRRTTSARPRRSIMIAHWDAEEYGIIGSTEWVEEFRDVAGGERNRLHQRRRRRVSGANFGSSSSPSLKGQIHRGHEGGDVPRAPANPCTTGGWSARAPGAMEPGARQPRRRLRPRRLLHPRGRAVRLASPPATPAASTTPTTTTSRGTSASGTATFAHGPMIARADGILALCASPTPTCSPTTWSRYATDTRTHVETLYRRRRPSAAWKVDLSRPRRGDHAGAGRGRRRSWWRDARATGSGSGEVDARRRRRP